MTERRCLFLHGASTGSMDTRLSVIAAVKVGSFKPPYLLTQQGFKW
jgi:hypothetical protein